MRKKTLHIFGFDKFVISLKKTSEKNVLLESGYEAGNLPPGINTFVLNNASLAKLTFLTIVSVKTFLIWKIDVTLYIKHL